MKQRYTMHTKFMYIYLGFVRISWLQNPGKQKREYHDVFFDATWINELYLVKPSEPWDEYATQVTYSPQKRTHRASLGCVVGCQKTRGYTHWTRTRHPWDVATSHKAVTKNCNTPWTSPCNHDSGIGNLAPYGIPRGLPPPASRAGLVYSRH